jgi:radical SAM protein with 4Fe4S-binding SPASM domain
MDRKLAEKMSRKCLPLGGSLELTHRCNLSCRHCYQYSPRGGEMESGDWIRIMKEAAGEGCLFLAFTGGEPLLREDLFPLLEAAGEMNYAVTLQTNATLLDGKKVRILADMPHVGVDVSLYGARSSTHDSFTGEEGSHLATLRSLYLLRENEVPVMVKVIVGNFNLGEVREMARLVEEMEVPVLFSALIFPRNDRDEGPLRFRLDDKGLEEFFLFEKEFLPPYLEEITGVEVGDLSEYLERCILSPVGTREEEKKRYCGAGRTLFAVNPYGDLYPCVAFPYVVGNLMEEGFADVWYGSPSLLELREKEEQLPPACSECVFLERCGLCRALSYQESGDVLGVSTEKCRMTRTMSRVLCHG